MCLICPIASVIGGAIGGALFGVYPPKYPEEKLFGIAITASLVSITTIALNILFNISLCGGGGFTLANIAIVSLKAIVMGTLYSIGVNYLLGRYVLPSSNEKNSDFQQGKDQLNENETCPHCTVK